MSGASRSEAACKWWRALQPNAETGRAGDRAALARLRRASPLEALAMEPVIQLFGKLGYKTPEDAKRHLPRLATLACILAHVRPDQHRDGIRFGRAIGRERGEDADSAPLKPLRFQRLLAAETEEEIARGFIRALAILRAHIDVRELAELVLNFDRDEQRQRLVFDYYHAGFAAPASDATLPHAS